MIYHIMKHYSGFGFREFILALGYKQELFKNYFTHFSEINYDTLITPNSITPIEFSDYEIILSDTGENTLKGGRLKRIEPYVTSDVFMVTYGDAVSDVNIYKLLEFHKKHGRMVTLTGVNPTPRFGELVHENGKISSYKEKPKVAALINGGFMVMNREVFKFLDRDCDLEVGPFGVLAEAGELGVYHHTGNWRCMDTLNDMIDLQKLWDDDKQQFWG